MTQEPQRDAQATRRGVLAGVGLVGLAGAISACSSGGSPAGANVGAPAATTPSSAPSAASGGNAAASGLATTSEIPVGGGKIFTSEKVVVTQPNSGDFKAFSAVCTHAGCTVGFEGGVIICPCHGGEFDAETGEVIAGPPPAGLAPKKVLEAGGQIYALPS